MRFSGHTPLSALNSGELPQTVSAILPSLWVESLEEAISLTAAADAAGLKGNMLDELKHSLAALTIGMPEEALAPWKKTPVINEQLGYHVDPEMRMAFMTQRRVSSFGRTSFSISNSPLPPAVRLMDKMQPVQNQGNRGTCVAFSVAALREYLAQEHGKLSEQFLYWACKRLDGNENEAGTSISAAMVALAELGICHQKHWPYNPKFIEGNEHQGPPSETAKQDAGSKIFKDDRPMANTNINHYKRVLAGENEQSGAPVAFGVLVFDSWLRSAATNSTGKITMPLPGEPPCHGGHAMLAVGYQDDPGVPGGGYLIVRNSWGEDWAANSPEALGHAMMPYAYVEQCALEAFSGVDVAELNIAPAGMVQNCQDQKHVLVLDDDMRDINGKLLRNGKRVIQDPKNPERIVEYTPQNLAAFKNRNNRL